MGMCFQKQQPAEYFLRDVGFLYCLVTSFPGLKACSVFVFLSEKSTLITLKTTCCRSLVSVLETIPSRRVFHVDGQEMQDQEVQGIDFH